MFRTTESSACSTGLPVAGMNRDRTSDAGREDPLEPRLLALYRAATPEQKLLTVMRLNHTLQGLKEAQLSVARPEWNSAQRQAELRRWWFSARD